eukprot:CAMPEP_0179308140 /NCGR_PEP_ID=MMETSP0797-20121207/50995_1 /TAXON_ID=47934 /ORGANISM="Dinophysis acuminata, Strain DAEP01" /LENGTH=248 /DNA_ID=CAMNT_0021017829 /DNA_START=140 /DNA_END=882 /DNA_ORIENTATION=-
MTAGAAAGGAHTLTAAAALTVMPAASGRRTPQRSHEAGSWWGMRPPCGTSSQSQLALGSDILKLTVSAPLPWMHHLRFVQENSHRSLQPLFFHTGISLVGVRLVWSWYAPATPRKSRAPWLSKSTWSVSGGSRASRRGARYCGESSLHSLLGQSSESELSEFWKSHQGSSCAQAPYLASSDPVLPQQVSRSWSAPSSPGLPTGRGARAAGNAGSPVRPDAVSAPARSEGCGSANMAGGAATPLAVLPR